MVVVAVVAILAMLAVPSYQDRMIRQQVAEGVGLVDFVRSAVQGFYAARHALPVDNADAGLPAATQIVGNFVSNVAVSGGAFTITYGNRANPSLAGKQLSLRPPLDAGAPRVPIAWVCGRASVPAGMTVMGVDATSLPVSYLPLNCR